MADNERYTYISPWIFEARGKENEKLHGAHESNKKAHNLHLNIVMLEYSVCLK